MTVVHLHEPAIPVPLEGSDGGNKIQSFDNDFDTDMTANPAAINVEVARCFCSLAELENGVFERSAVMRRRFGDKSGRRLLHWTHCSATV